MADGVDIGTLSGRIEFEDHVTATMDTVLKKLDVLEDKFKNLGSTVADSAKGFFAAEIGLHALEAGLDKAVDVIKDMTIEGAGIADVEENFHRLTDEVGRLSSTLLDQLREGTHATITDFELMKTVNKDLAAGMNLTDQQYRKLADGAFALAQATGKDVKEAFDIVNDAMLTGRTRSLQMLTGRVDTTKAEQDFAESLGITSDRLSEQGKLEAARIAILESVGKATAKLGLQTDGLDEMVAQLETSWTNFYEDLAKSVATSPAVIGAFVSVRDALVEAFGGDKQSMLKTFMEWINKGAEAVANYGPVVVQGFIEIKKWVVDVYDTIKSGWDTLPDWFKTAATNSALAAAGFFVFSKATEAATLGTVDLIGAVGSIATTLSDMPVGLAKVSDTLGLMASSIKAFDFSSFVDARASLNLMGEAALGAVGPLGALAIVSAAIFAAYEIGKTQPVSDFFESLGLQLQGLSVSEAEAAVKTHHMLDAQEAQAAAAQKQKDALEAAKEMVRQLTEQTKPAAKATDDFSASQERNRLIIEHTNEEIKKRREALKEIESATGKYKDIVLALDQDMVKSVKSYLEAGVAQDKLATAYGLTNTQISAIVHSLKDEQENLKLEQKQVSDSTKRWSDYYATQLEMSGRTTDMVIANIERWSAAQVRSHVDAKTDTADFYAWLAATTQQMSDQADQARLTQDVHSKAYWQLQRTEAQDAYQFALMHADQFTQGYINGLRLTKEAAEDAADHWQNSIGTELDKEAAQAKKLADAMRSLGGSFDVTSQNFSESLHSINTNGGWTTGRFNEAEGYALARKGYSFEEIIKILESKGSGPVPPPRGPRIPGFREGGIGDFGDGTMAILHGKEAIVPLDRAGAAGLGMTNHFYVNGTGKQVAKEVADILMNQAMSGRKFGTS